MKNRILIFLLLVILSTELSSQQTALASRDDDASKASKQTYKEITKTDITKYTTIISTQILVFGISFRMTIADALAVVESNPNIFFKVDPFNNNRYYLYDNEIVNGKNLALAYFIWDEQGLELREIILYTGFSKYLVGNSRYLLTFDVINKNAAIVKEFMGYPSKKETALDLPSIGIKSFNYYYPNHNFKVIRNFSDTGSSIAFGLLREITY